eukprot:TRINITY_DN7934_c0_g1_i2.p1 TRINITY_DN7934_c0_g1~~TRINITY_DN7934_c0_g1_i2.p1  ORF type:complete len:973 (+),score=185.56 TRINITY_DN7934_c0_g1_i2:138-3056(+)
MGEPSDEAILSLKRDDIRLLSLKRTEGCFGWYDGQYRQPSAVAGKKRAIMSVGVKLLSSKAMPSHEKAIRREAAIMVGLDHPNVLKLVGMHKSGPPAMLVHEEVENGSLAKYLRASQLDGAILRKFALDVARATAYLHARNLVHWDIAARNVFLNADMNCKLGNFGCHKTLDDKAPDGFYTSDTGNLCMRWSPPEVGMAEGSERTIYPGEDLWCYGFFLYELFTKGRIPYGRTTWTNSQEYLDTMVEMQEGGLLPKPDHCPEDMYQLMSDCWRQDPNKRPRAKVIEARLVSPSAMAELDNILSSADDAMSQGLQESEQQSSGGLSTDDEQYNGDMNNSLETEMEKPLDLLAVPSHHRRSKSLGVAETNNMIEELLNANTPTPGGNLQTPSPPTIKPAGPSDSTNKPARPKVGFAATVTVIGQQEPASPSPSPSQDEPLGVVSSAPSSPSTRHRGKVGFATNVTVIGQEEPTHVADPEPPASLQPPSVEVHDTDPASSSRASNSRGVKRRPSPFASKRASMASTASSGSSRPTSVLEPHDEIPKYDNNVNDRAEPASSPAATEDVSKLRPKAQRRPSPYYQSGPPPVPLNKTNARTATSTSSYASASTPLQIEDDGEVFGFDADDVNLSSDNESVRPSSVVMNGGQFPTFAQATAAYKAQAPSSRADTRIPTRLATRPGSYGAAPGRGPPVTGPGRNGTNMSRNTSYSSQSSRSNRGPSPSYNGYGGPQPRARAGYGQRQMMYPPLSQEQQHQLVDTWDVASTVVDTPVHTTSALVQENVHLRAELLAMRQAIADTLALSQAQNGQLGQPRPVIDPATESPYASAPSRDYVPIRHRGGQPPQVPRQPTSSHYGGRTQSRGASSRSVASLGAERRSGGYTNGLATDGVKNRWSRHASEGSSGYLSEEQQSRGGKTADWYPAKGFHNNTASSFTSNGYSSQKPVNPKIVDRFTKLMTNPMDRQRMRSLHSDDGAR